MVHMDYPDPCIPNDKKKDIEIYRDYLRKVSSGACSYCTLKESESIGSVFQIEHFRPKKHFPKYEFEYMNLRYSCPRCNSHKHSYWIGTELGCKRDCDTCNKKLCEKDIPRIIDCVKENPVNHIYLKENGEIDILNHSQPGIFTIKRLRLNSKQLIKHRVKRKTIEEWYESLKKDLKNAESKHSYWVKYLNKYNDACVELLILLYEHMSLHIRRELETLNALRFE